ncbi:MAG: hypothetical protein ACE5GE_17155, partial [Phycisphaerae bacterium]
MGWTVGLAGVVVAVGVCLVFWPVLSVEALHADDHDYVIHNVLVRNPGWASAERFFGEVLEPSTVGGYYHPLSMVSLMVDCAMGASPQNLRPFHRTSLILHAGNSALIVVLIYLLVGRVWAAVLVGLLFGVHPLGVESVAWIGERKNLLAAFFGLGSLIGYVLFVGRSSRGWLVASVGLFGISLLAKPTTLPLPILLLLLDYWPMNRLGRRAVLEKVPYLVLAAASAMVTLISQGRTAGWTDADRSVVDTLLVLCHNLAFYPLKILWPAGLSSHYPLPDGLSITDATVVAGLIGAMLVTGVLVFSLRRTRALLVGGLFFWVGIFPALGVVGFTDVIAADRFTYFPMVGLLLALGWAMVLAKRTAVIRLVVAGALLAVSAEAWATRKYLVHWKDTASLYQHMIATAPEVADLRWTLCNHFLLKGQPEAALPECQEAVRLAPDALEAQTNLGNTLSALGRLDDAVGHFEAALSLDEASAVTHNDLGALLAKRTDLAGAVGQQCSQVVMRD